jgi:uncharacterized membrane protein
LKNRFVPLQVRALRDFLEKFALEQPFAAPSAQLSARVESIDLLRGLVMIIMALDHTRDFFTYGLSQPENLSRSYPALFFTRWITHFCAPVFFLLAGTGASLSVIKGWSIRKISKFLWTRGSWLVFLELTFVGFSYTFSTRYEMAVVFWALGWSMVVLALLVRTPTWVVLTFSGILIVFHNVFAGEQVSSWSLKSFVVSFLHAPSIHVTSSGITIAILYPLIPWVAVMTGGYAFGQLYRMDGRRRVRIMLEIGTASTLAFVVLRTLNRYGDPRPWSHQGSPLMTLCSFLNCTKYPPSLCFLLMTLGPAILFLAAFDGKVLPFLNPILIFGRVPLFFFVAHLYVIHLAAIVVAIACHQPSEWLLHGAVMVSKPTGYGHGLSFIYIVWAAVVGALYPACRWYAGLKRRSKNPLLSYL